jgi:hypothetical protein
MRKLAQPPVGTRQNGALGYIDFPRDVGQHKTREKTPTRLTTILAVQRVRAIGFNFSATDYLNSAGIGLIISLVEDATCRRTQGLRLWLELAQSQAVSAWSV